MNEAPPLSHEETMSASIGNDPQHGDSDQTSDEHCPFIEICSPSATDPNENDELPMIAVFVASVPSKQCASLLKELSQVIPKDREFSQLSHWKRVQRSKQNQPKEEEPLQGEQSQATTESNEENKSPIAKKRKTSKSKAKVSTASSSSSFLRVLIGRVDQIRPIIDEATKQPERNDPSPCSQSLSFGWNRLLQNYPSLQQLETIYLPSRPPQSNEEYQEWNRNIWPCTFYPLRVAAAMAESVAVPLTPEQVSYMQWGMQEAYDDLIMSGNCLIDATNGPAVSSFSNFGGAVLTRPPTVVEATVATSSSQAATTDDSHSTTTMAPIVIARSSEEFFKQQSPSSSSSNGIIYHNPLSTPIMLALQGVSRLERQAAMGFGMDHPNFQKGQYLCTGYDLFTVVEPTVMEAMACVHARVRQVVFGIGNPTGGAFIGTIRGVSSTSTHHPDDNGNNTTCNGNHGLFLHALPGTNHRYKVYTSRPHSELWSKCKEQQLRSSTSPNVIVIPK